MKKIIACVDGSLMAHSVCQAGAWLSERLSVPLVLLHSIEKDRSADINLAGNIGLGANEVLLQQLADNDAQKSKLLKAHSKALLEHLQQSLPELNSPVATLERFGDVNHTLSDIKESIRCYVMGRSGENHASDSNLVGSHIESALRLVDRSMLLTVGEFKQPQSFLLAYDGREQANLAIERLLETKLLADCDCHLVMVGNTSHATKDAFDKELSRLESQFASITPHFVDGDNIAESLLAKQLELNVDLTVMGAFSHSKVRQFFVGSNTLKLITNSHTSLLVIK
ncbi:universal stress protein [Pseudoalteromonas sp. SCSIO 43095]|uniref:universal stress protein n=1 Tax=Pseudoalteromonas TaxID=53246 RepID=UPI00202AD0C3|nr:universal stress protein [Pseudoalteromonas sp. SCSIO 43095]URQ98088.1 universal stress protein [Pseudoalteromonas sp. SCSIO 43095]